MDIGASIKKLRIKKGITQHQLAEHLNVSMQTISRWETSATYPDVVMLPILARYFRVTVDYLLNVGGNIMKTIESDRLLIREWSENDAGDLFEMKQTSNSFMDFLKFNTVNDSLDCIKIWKEYQEMYPVILKSTGKVIGVAGLVDINRYKGYRELEVHICDKYNNADYMTEAHKLILDYGFNELGLVAAFTLCGCDDEIIKQAMLKTGFVYEGTLRKFGRDMSDRMRYSVLKDAYLSAISAD
jgi:RimJ/RimL family protein N-acetyltransferase